MAGDKGYSYPSVRAELRRRGIRAVIPTKSDQPRRCSFDRPAYRERNKVERAVGRLKQFRRVATRYEKGVPVVLGWEATPSQVNGCRQTCVGRSLAGR